MSAGPDTWHDRRIISGKKTRAGGKVMMLLLWAFWCMLMQSCCFVFWSKTPGSRQQNMASGFGNFERERAPADIGPIWFLFGKGRNEFWMVTGKKEVERSLYTHTQAPKARTLQNANSRKTVVVIITRYIYILRPYCFGRSLLLSTYTLT